MSSIELFKLIDNPFKILDHKEINSPVWAGFPEIKQKIENEIIRFLKLQRAGIMTNWGGYGCGKTHAANYFCSTKVLDSITNKINVAKPLALKILLPKGRSPIKDILTVIVDKLDISHLRSVMKPYAIDINNDIDSQIDDSHLRAILKMVFSSNIDINLVKSYLYSSTSAAELRYLKKHDIFRSLNTDEDYIKVLIGLIEYISYKRIVYSGIILWIDEFEDIALLSPLMINRINYLLRELTDNSNNKLLIFVNITNTSLVQRSDLSYYLSAAAIDRLTSTIEFKPPTFGDVLLYLDELLNHELYRKKSDISNDSRLFPFTQELIKSVYENLKVPSVRSINNSLFILLGIASESSVRILDNQFFKQHENEVI